MSTPVIIRHEAPLRAPSQGSHAAYGSSPSGSLPPCSPPAAFSYHSPLGVAGASPPFRGGSSSAAADKANPYLAAKKFWKRLCFDPALDPTEYSIGFIETVQQPERKSGVEAWSMRLHDRLVELPYNQFVDYFCGGGGGGSSLVAGGGGGSRISSGGGGIEGAVAATAALLHPRHASPSTSWGGGGGFLSTSEEAASDVPYHRIAYFKHGGTVVWESEYHKRRLDYLPPALGLPHAHPPSHPPHLPHPPHLHPHGAATSDGGAGAAPALGAAAAAAGAAAGDRMRRRASREGMPPLPFAASPGFHSSSLPMSLFGGGCVGTPARGAAGVTGRSPRGASPLGSEDGGPGGDSSECEDDPDLLLLEEDEEEGEEQADGEQRSRDSQTGRRNLFGEIWGLGSGSGGGVATHGSFEEAAPMPQLPEECWMAMLQQLGVREVCMVGRTCRWLRQLASDPDVWRSQHSALWGHPPEPSLQPAVVRRLCRRSQLRAARWLEAAVKVTPGLGFPSTTCLQMDDSKVVSADGNAVRLWSHASGRRIATLQGHPARVTAVAFDESLLVSGCAGAVVKLWSMDELRCRRTLRGHDGAVSSCCLLPTGIPVSGGEDGLMRLWDVASGAAIVGLEAGHPVRAMQAHAPSGHLVVAAGGGVQIWDVSTATLLHTLGSNLDPAAAAAAAAAGGDVGAHHADAAAVQQQQHPYTCVSYMGELLAAGRQGEVVLMDPRVGSAVGRIRCNVGSGSSGGGAVGSGAGNGGYGSLGGGSGGGFANGLGAIAAAAAAGSVGSDGGGGKGAPCVGVQMDEWKLVCGFKDGKHELHVYDIRSLPKATAAAAAAGGGSGGGAAGGWSCGKVVRSPWHVPLMTLKAPARINAFQFHEQALLAGLEGGECVMWRFEDPNISATPAGAAGGGGSLATGTAAAAATSGGGMGGRPGGAGSSGGGGGGGLASGGGGIDGFGAEGAGGGRKEKKKPAKVAKKQTRYPKRNTK